MLGQVTRNIVEYMNGFSKKTFTYYEVCCIRDSIKIELRNRKKENLILNVKTKAGKEIINKRIAEIVNSKLNTDKIAAEDVRLYKRCFAQEYSDRTGKCSWGFKEVRKRLGYNPDTGKEID